MVINLVASNYMDGILLALARPVLVPENVCAEFQRDPRDGSGYYVRSRTGMMR